MDKITFGNDLPGYEAGSKSAPAIIVLQEWWGVTEAIKELALTISAAGFRVLIPDLYKGKLGVDAEEASHLMGSLDFKNAVEEFKQAVQYLKSSGSAKVGAVGFCMGGALSFAAAQHAGVVCAAPFYGIPDPKICQLDQIKVPVQAHFGKLDNHKGFSDPETAEKAVNTIKAAGGDAELFFYEGCGHGFMNVLTVTGKDKFKLINAPVPPPAEAQAALDRTLAFFKSHLQ